MKEAPTTLAEAIAWRFVRSTPEAGEAISWRGAKLETFRNLERKGYLKHEWVMRGIHSKICIHYWWKEGEVPLFLKIK